MIVRPIQRRKVRIANLSILEIEASQRIRIAVPDFASLGLNPLDHRRKNVFSQNLLAVIKSRIVMNKNDLNMQRLHQSAVNGEILTAEEQKVLQNWYELLDREENSILNNSQLIQNVPELRRNLAQTTKQVAKISREIGTLLKQNDDLRKENQLLKKTLESRLVEKVA